METRKHCTLGKAQTQTKPNNWVALYYGCSLSPGKTARIFRALHWDKRVIYSKSNLHTVTNSYFSPFCFQEQSNWNQTDGHKPRYITLLNKFHQEGHSHIISHNAQNTQTKSEDKKWQSHWNDVTKITHIYIYYPASHTSEICRQITLFHKGYHQASSHYLTSHFSEIRKTDHIIRISHNDSIKPTHISLQRNPKTIHIISQGYHRTKSHYFTSHSSEIQRQITWSHKDIIPPTQLTLMISHPHLIFVLNETTKIKPQALTNTTNHLAQISHLSQNRNLLPAPCIYPTLLGIRLIAHIIVSVKTEDYSPHRVSNTTRNTLIL